MLGSRSPASSLLDLAYLGLTPSGEPLTQPKPDAPFVGIRPGLVAEESFDRPHTWSLPTDDGKMADTQSATTATSQPAERRGDLLEIDTSPEQQPVFTLAAVRPPDVTVADPAPAPPSHAVGDVSTAAPPAESAEVAAPLPAFLRGPAPQVKVGGDDQPSMPGIAVSSYSGGSGGGGSSGGGSSGGGSGGGSTGPLPGGFVVGMKVQEVDFQGDAVVVAADPNGPTSSDPDPGDPDDPDPGNPGDPGDPDPDPDPGEPDPGDPDPGDPNAVEIRYPTQDGLPEWRDANLDGVIQDSAVLNSDTGKLDPVEWSVPVAYKRGATPVVSAKFKVTALGSAPQGASKQLTVRGLWQGYGGDGIACPPVVVPAEGDYVYYPPTATSSPLPNYVDSVESAGIDWQFQIQGDMTWYSAGMSNTEMFVTLDQPSDEEPVYHTVVALSTRASWGATTPQKVIDGTWVRFETRSLSTMEPAFRPLVPTPLPPAPIGLHYYKAWDTKVTTTSGLLRTGDGQCGAWTRLFRDSLKIQSKAINAELWNIESAKRQIVGNVNMPAESLAVNDWDFPGNGGGIIAGYPYLNFTPVNNKIINFVVDKVTKVKTYYYDWKVAPAPEANDLPGVEGQGLTSNPASLFAVHQVVKIDGGDRIYDPSYGVTKATLAEWEDNSLAGFATDTRNQGFLAFRKNPAGLDVIIKKAPNQR